MRLHWSKRRDERPPLSPDAERVRDAVLAAERPLTTAELAERAGLPRDTVEGHLDELRRRGIVLWLPPLPEWPDGAWTAR